MASIGKPKVRISSKDLKQAVLKKNKSLEAKNKTLELSSKALEKELKSLDKQRSTESKKLSKLLVDVEFQEDRFQKLKGGIYSNDKLLSSKLEKVSKAESELCEYESAVEKLEDKEVELKKEIEALEFYKSKCAESKNELAGLQIKKDGEMDKIKNIKDDISKLYVDYNNKVLSYEREYDALEEKAKKHEDMVHQFEQRLFDAKDQAISEENNLERVLAKSKSEKEKADDELQAIKNLCNNAEDEYIKWEVKVDRAKVKVGKEEERYQKKIERGKRWDISFLEQVAKKKLKNKVDNIDKAGLRDVLDG